MKITLYTIPHCPFCNNAKTLLQEKGLDYTDYDVASDPELRARISKQNNDYRTVPMIFIDDKFIGGYTELVALDTDNKLRQSLP